MAMSFLTGVLLSLASSAPTLPGGAGVFEQVIGGTPVATWSLGPGIGVSDVTVRLTPPAFCTSTCAYDVSQAATGPFVLIGTYIVRPTFVFAGPVSTTTATCASSCPPGRFSYHATWAPVPITLTGSVRVTSMLDPADVVEYLIAGTGTAVAETHLYDDHIGDSRSVRYSFTYAVVPEPAPTALVASGLILLVAAARGTRQGGRAVVA